MNSAERDAEDFYVSSIDRVERTAIVLRDSVDTMVASLAQARQDRMDRVDLINIVSGLIARGGREARLQPTVAFRKFQQAVTAYRATAVRALVDEEHMTFSQIGELTGVSRQMIARLYRHTEPD
jgi:hypothetical protein